MAQIDVVMPKMGESVMEGTVLTWHKQPGEAIELDETLLEIGTDKVDSEIPSPAAGVLAEILVPEGETVEVGTIIARIQTEVTEGAPAPAPEPVIPVVTAPEPPVVVPEPEALPAPEAPVPVAASGAAVDVVMPKMGESVMEGTVLTWHKQPGEAIELDETLLEIGTDKVDSEIPSPAAGVLAEILVPEGDTVDVGTILARITTDAAAEVPAPATQPPAPAVAAPPILAPESTTGSTGDGAMMQEATPAVAAGPIPRRGTGGQFYSPLVRSIAEKEGMALEELEAIAGSGNEGRVTKKDVLAYLKNRKAIPASVMPARPPAAPKPAAPVTAVSGRVEIIEMDRMRQIIADHMTRSLATSAHVTSFAEADVTHLVRMRERNKTAFLDREGVKLTFTPFFVQAAVEALRDHPLLNSSVEEKRILVKKDYHIGIAVAIGQRGLVVPVIRNAGSKNLVGLAHAASDLANRARSKQLQPDELSGGTFTVTNIGSLGSLIGTPIINQPQVGILAVGAIKKRPVVVEDPVLGDVIAIRHMMYLSLTYDHRIIDGAIGSSFLQAVVKSLEATDPDEVL